MPVRDAEGAALLVDDDANVLRANRRALEHAGYVVQCAVTLEEAWRCLCEWPPDAIVLDVRMPDGSGIAFCERARLLTAAPVLFLSALDEKGEVLKALRAGGSDYIAKPCDVEELAARVDAQIALARMNRAASAKPLVRGSLELDLIAQRVCLDGRDLLFTPKDFSLLLFLAQREGEVLGADEIYRVVWGRPFARDAAALKSAVYRLRKKLAGSGYSVTARRGQGYVLAPSDE